jgi:hypothetical protein
MPRFDALAGLDHYWRNQQGRCQMSKQRTRLAALAILAIAAISVSACQTESQRVTQNEDNLAAAGFIVKPANTPERQQMLHRLPAHTFVQRVNGDVIHYVFADPLVCGCLYVGTQQAYNAYKLHQQQQNLADEQAMTAQTYSDPAWSWNAWGPWGPVAPYGFVYGPGYGW